MQSTVWFSDLSAPPGRSLIEKTGQLLRAAGLAGKIGPGALTAVKLHFGERGNVSFVRPVFVRKIVEEIAAAGGKPFLTDTNTLYVGGRSNSVDHIRTAVANGFAFAVVDAPLLIADGIRGESSISVPVEGNIYSEVAIGTEIVNADALVAVTHFKGHELSGFGGTIKNLGMGCAARSGKLAQHSTVSPTVDPAACTGCGTCVAHCPSGAIEVISEKALINPGACIGCADCIVVCPEHTVIIDWNEAAPMVQKKMVEHAVGALRGKSGKSLFISFVMQISPYCDCYGNNDRPIAPDVGIFASGDPVALDQACADAVIRSAGRDPFRETHPEIDWTIQLSYAEELGLGTRNYLLETL
ncbi:MAG: DUF362 domain-containing protein [Deltaproteobacteria bacterium]|jgi:uncharacterized Fe-S center protein|nr:DUF362 domain-containing protein [Deltaproteobacteria bacterium]